MAVIELTEDNFKEHVLNSDKPVLVDFWAPWCGPCRVMLPIIEEVAKEHPEIIVGKVDASVQEDLVTLYNILSIPCFMLFKEGIVIAKTEGALSKKELLKTLNL